MIRFIIGSIVVSMVLFLLFLYELLKDARGILLFQGQGTEISLIILLVVLSYLIGKIIVDIIEENK